MNKKNKYIIMLSVAWICTVFSVYSIGVFALSIAVWSVTIIRYIDYKVVK